MRRTIMLMGTYTARANRHWTDEECASRLLGELHRLERYESRWRSVLGGLGLVALVVIGAMALLAW